MVVEDIIEVVGVVVEQVHRGEGWWWRTLQRG
jgi:hypothetical protein